jgi:transglutaminase-like putative cysteine protease
VKYRVTHSTRYDYAQPVSLSHNIVRLHPRNHGPQTCLEHRLTIVPAPATRSDQLDYFGNYCDYFCLQQTHNELTITAQSEVEVVACAWADLSHGPSWEQVRDDLACAANDDAVFAREFTFDSPHALRSAELEEYARPSFPEGRPLLDAAMDLTKRIHDDFKFLPGSTNVNTPVLEVLHTRKGVCQDFSHLQISCLRSLGLAARYVSGYLVTTPPPGKKRLVGADVSHAWVSVFSSAADWVDFDPTNGVMPSDSHITIAWGRDYSDVGPIRGILVGGRRHRLHVSVDVVPQEPAS